MPNYRDWIALAVELQDAADMAADDPEIYDLDEIEHQESLDYLKSTGYTPRGSRKLTPKQVVQAREDFWLGRKTKMCIEEDLDIENAHLMLHSKTYRELPNPHMDLDNHPYPIVLGKSVAKEDHPRTGTGFSEEHRLVVGELAYHGWTRAATAEHFGVSVPHVDKCLTFYRKWASLPSRNEKEQHMNSEEIDITDLRPLKFLMRTDDWDATEHPKTRRVLFRGSHIPARFISKKIMGWGVLTHQGDWWVRLYISTKLQQYLDLDAIGGWPVEAMLRLYTEERNAERTWWK